MLLVYEGLEMDSLSSLSYVCYFLDAHVSYFKVIILDVRIPSSPVAKLNNHRAQVNGMAWAPHSSCHICTAGICIYIYIFKQIDFFYVIYFFNVS